MHSLTVIAEASCKVGARHKASAVHAVQVQCLCCTMMLTGWLGNYNRAIIYNKEDRACIMHPVEGEANVHVPHDI